MKICPKCKERPRAKNRGWCVECSREASRKYYETHREQCKAARKRWRLSLSGEALERQLEKEREYRRRFCESHPDYYSHTAEYQREWRSAHPDKVAAYNAYATEKRRQQREADKYAITMMKEAMRTIAKENNLTKGSDDV